ncbi:glycoside hydrolase family 9 protein [Ruminiclostridium herbifermentans]|uniref:cellulase n=1 Tax=Ruminiclostridium herbifermentans TaxID=2488810 RepID=A0A4U7JB88_9FIRM|nr:glycoside hydrolase family 9 protein [Ruminiclostridium herbifermentans]QNU67297.1 glycoside hydrolase family 9 protein [Ruminiclostridium herbifermentans]
MKSFIFKKAAFLLAIAILISAFPITDSFAYWEVIASNFDKGEGLPWHVVVNEPAKAISDISDGKYKITILNAGLNRWDIMFRHRGLTIEKGHQYKVKFTVVASENCKIYAKVGDQGEPFEEYWNYNNRSWSPINLQANVPLTVEENFTMYNATKDVCEFSFFLGGDMSLSEQQYTVAFDDIYLIDLLAPPPPPLPSEPTNEIRVNQEGYFPTLNKIATLVSDSTTPVSWNLVNSAGKIVASGSSKVKGLDTSSGDNVHIIDFSSYMTVGSGYKLISGEFESLPFDISNELYSDLKYDAIKYFYHNRSGINIQMPYADKSELSRSAINPKDVVSLDPRNSNTDNYTLDITGGWNDDEGNGKCVVNSSIATWTLMNKYEQALYNGNVEVSPYADITMNIPESGNGIPDILDEARYNLQAMLKMQVPAGKSLSGMVHHKVSDRRVLSLTGVETVRFLQPPSTAATLDLAAVAAQASRLFKNYDSEFANQCLVAAETAWDAAIANPELFVPFTYGVLDKEYGDDYVGDEFYWAASELYITTGKAKYLDYIKNSQHFLEVPTKLTEGIDIDTTGCFDWCNTAGMGTLSLSMAPTKLTVSDFKTIKENIIKAADKFIAIADSQGYGVPIEECAIDNSGSRGFPYCSNSYILNEAIVMAYAYELSGNIKYLNGMTSAMDYILGRNPMLQSYITGYGDNPLENPHHMYWSYQDDNSTPKPPAGVLSSGPNSGLQDSWVKGTGWNSRTRPPEKCFMDNIYSWSTNDSELNLNAPLVWVSAYLDENVIKTPPPPPPFFGDINDDDSIDALDLAAVKKYLLSQGDFLLNVERADVNGDGSVDALDYALLKQYLLGIIKYFPVEEMRV